MNENSSIVTVWTGVDWGGLGWTGVDWGGLGWTGGGLGRTGVDWGGLGWTGVDWAGVDQFDFEFVLAKRHLL